MNQTKKRLLKKTFKGKIRVFFMDIREHFRFTDLLAGLGDACLCIGFLYLLLCSHHSFAASILADAQWWFGWELLTLIIVPPFIWMFGNDGDKSPYQANVPRYARVFIFVISAILLFNFELAVLWEKILIVWPFLAARALCFLLTRPGFRDFNKAIRRLAIAIVFAIVALFPFAVLGNHFDGTVILLSAGACYYGFFTFVEILAWPLRRAWDLDRLDHELD